MHRSIALTALLLTGIAGSIALSGCNGPHAVIRESSADRVEIGYYEDLGSAMAAARQACARYERVPQLDHTEPNIAIYRCLPSAPPARPGLVGR
jgi:hypothetical protein